MGNSGELVKTHLIGLFAKGENRGRPVIVQVQTYVVTLYTTTRTTTTRIPQNPSTVTNPAMEPYCILLPLKVQNKKETKTTTKYSGVMDFYASNLRSTSISTV